MLTAINMNGIRITPFSNEKGFCPLCKSEVIKAVGEIYTPHFRHKTLQNCDSWSEGETEWHYNWKQKFPIDWQEVVIEKYGELHRADIKTNKGLVLELQNSSISTTTIKIREDFYGNMIWLVNAKSFKDNFKIRSLVKQKLRYSDEEYFQSFDLNPNKKTPFIEDLEENLQTKNHTHRQIFNEIDYLYNDLKKLKDYEKDFDNVLKDYLKGNYVSSIVYEFKTEEKSKIKEQNIELEKLIDELEKINQTLNKINSLPNCLVKDYTNWKVLKFDMIAPTSYTNCKVIFKDTADTFFPDIIDIQTTAQFQNYKRNSEKYILILDLSNRKYDLNNQIKNIESKISSIKENEKELINSISNQLSKWLKNKKKDVKKSINLKTEIKEGLEVEIIDLMNEVINEKELEENRQIESSKRLSKLYEQEQIKIKIENKGLYTYHWKNKRKTWEYANMPVYLDFGDCIFEVLSDYKLAKISIDEFIKRVKNS